MSETIVEILVFLPTGFESLTLCTGHNRRNKMFQAPITLFGNQEKEEEEATSESKITSNLNLLLFILLLFKNTKYSKFKKCRYQKHCALSLLRHDISSREAHKNQAVSIQLTYKGMNENAEGSKIFNLSASQLKIP